MKKKTFFIISEVVAYLWVLLIHVVVIYGAINSLADHNNMTFGGGSLNGMAIAQLVGAIISIAIVTVAFIFAIKFTLKKK